MPFARRSETPRARDGRTSAAGREGHELGELVLHRDVGQGVAAAALLAVLRAALLAHGCAVPPARTRRCVCTSVACRNASSSSRRMITNRRSASNVPAGVTTRSLPATRTKRLILPRVPPVSLTWSTHWFQLAPPASGNRQRTSGSAKRRVSMSSSVPCATSPGAGHLSMRSTSMLPICASTRTVTPSASMPVDLVRLVVVRRVAEHLVDLVDPLVADAMLRGRGDDGGLRATHLAAAAAGDAAGDRRGQRDGAEDEGASGRVHRRRIGVVGHGLRLAADAYGCTRCSSGFAAPGAVVGVAGGDGGSTTSSATSSIHTAPGPNRFTPTSIWSAALATLRCTS